MMMMEEEEEVSSTSLAALVEKLKASIEMTPVIEVPPRERLLQRKQKLSSTSSLCKN